MKKDPHRPQYHFLLPTNWMNDPKGLIHWQGRDDMFYQCNPHATQRGDIHWGHLDRPGLGIFAQGGEILVPRLDLYQLAPAW